MTNPQERIMITSVWSSYGHRFMSDGDDYESCLTCGAMYQLIADPDDPTRGEYMPTPANCTHDTSMVHGYYGEAYCDSCNNVAGGCLHCVHQCPCLACGTS